MYVIRLGDGRLRVPCSEMTDDGHLVQAYVEIGPEDPDYARLERTAVTEEQLAQTRRRWQEDDEALRVQFEEFKAAQEDA